MLLGRIDRPYFALIKVRRRGCVGGPYCPFLGFILIIFEIFTQNIDSKFDSAKALINKTGRALRARQSGFCQAFVESKFEAIFCVNISKLINIITRVTAVRVTALLSLFGFPR